MTDHYNIEKKFSFLGKDLIAKLLDVSVIKSLPTNIELVREGQYVKYIPIVLSGLVKVYTQFEEKELLLYYIKPDQSCIMSFSSCINNGKSKIFAITEEESIVYPKFKTDELIKKHLKFKPNEYTKNEAKIFV